MSEPHRFYRSTFFFFLFTTFLTATTHYVDNNTSDGTWSGAYTDLQSAISAASSGDEIWVAKGTYYPTSGSDIMISFDIPDGVSLYGGFLGGESSRSFRDWENNETILSGDIGTLNVDTDNSYHVVTFIRVSDQTTLDGFTITKGYSDGVNDDIDLERSGGGIFIDGSGSGNSCSPNLVNLTIIDNYSDSMGGGIFMYGENSGNIAATVTNCTISNNLAYLGAAFYLHGRTNGYVVPQFTDCRFTENQATSKGGGGYLYSRYSGRVNPTFDRCVFSGNEASHQGGGLHMNPRDNGDCMPNIYNTLFSGNKAGTSGGAIYSYAIDGGEGEPNIYNCTFSGNEATYGSAMRCWIDNGGQAGFYIVNSIIWGNEPGNEGQVAIGYNTAPSTSYQPKYSYCLLEGSSSSSWNTQYGPTTGDYCIDSDPEFINAMAYTNAPTANGDYQLQSDSPCIGAGKKSYAPGDYDLNNVDRVSNLSVEIGAYECVLSDLFVDVDAVGIEDGLSWSNAYTDLQSALSTAQSGVTIWVAEGTYVPTPGSDRTISFSIPSNVLVYGGFDGSETELSERDPDNNVTILSGDIGTTDDNSDNSYHVVVFDEVDINTTLEGFTITEGKADGADPWDDGAGIYLVATGSNNCKPQIVNCRVINNEAQDKGGGIFMDGGSSTGYNKFYPYITRSVISGNLAGYRGGAICIDGQGGRVAPQIKNCLISGNRSEGWGGGIVAYGHNSGYVYVTISGTTIAGNSAATAAGAVYLNGSSDGFCKFLMKSSIIWGNSRKGEQVLFNDGEISGSNTNIENCGGENDPQTGFDGSLFDAKPLFVSLPDTSLAPTTTGDFRLYNSSPCIGVGTGSDSDNEDITGATRPDNCDLGAYENVLNEKYHHLRVDPDVSGSVHNGMSWATAFPHPVDALRAGGEDDTIWVKAGTYYPDEGYGFTNNDRSATFKFHASISLYGGFDGSETSIDQRDGASNVTILNGDIDKTPEDWSGNAYHVVTFPYIGFPNNGISGARIHDVTITGGNANVEGDTVGGGVYIYNGFNEIHNCIIESNRAVNGGGIASEGNSADPLISGCSILNNVASADGGGFYASAKDFDLEQTRIAGNSAANNGGGIYMLNPYAPPITNCLITGNKAETAGDGAYVFWNADSYERYPVFTNCTIAANDEEGITYTSTGTTASVSLINSIVWGNTLSTTNYGTNSIVQGAHDHDTNPAFYDLPDGSEAPTVDGDFRLSDISPAIGAGTAVDAPTIDINGDSRGATPDIGAIENTLNTKNHRLYVGAETQASENPGTSWGKAFVHLQDAVQASADGDTIWIKAGTYSPDDGISLTVDDQAARYTVPSGVKIFGGFSGSEASLLERQEAGSETIISGDIGVSSEKSDNSSYLFYLENCDDETLLEGFTIRDAGIRAIWINDDQVTTENSPAIDNCKIIDNAQGIYIRNLFASSSPIIRNSQISGNYSSGGIYISSQSAQVTTTIENTVISGNYATSWPAIRATSASSTCFTNLNFCTIAGNRSGSGPILGTDVSDGSTMTIENSIIWGNDLSNGLTDDSGTGLFSFSKSIIQDSPSTDWNDAHGTDGGNNLDIDPLLTSLPAASSAPTSAGNFMPQSSSPCVEAGDMLTYDETTNHDCGWKADIGGVEYTGNRMSLPINGTGEYLFGGNVRMKVNVTVDNLDSLDITVHPGETHANDTTTVSRWYEVSQVGSGTYDLSFSYRDSELNENSEEALKLFRYANDSWSGDLGKTASSTGDNWITISNQTEGGEFAFKDEQTDSSLPVTLSEFKAEVHEDEVEIIWITDSEIENLGFILERRSVGFSTSSSRAESRDMYLEQTIAPFDSAQGDGNSWTQLATYQTHTELEGAGSSNLRSMYAFIDDDIEPGVIYEYRLADVSYSGEIVYHSMTLTEVMIKALPESFALMQNYPNPFNPVTTIRYALPEQSEINLIIFDLTGREVTTLKKGVESAGYHQLRWNGLDHSGRQVATGIYYCLMQTPQHRQTIKMMLLR